VSTEQDDAVCTNCGLIIAHGIVADEAAAGEAGEGCCEMKLVSDDSSGWELSTADSDYGLLSCSNADVVDEESNVANVASAALEEELLDSSSAAGRTDGSTVWTSSSGKGGGQWLSRISSSPRERYD
jgi:hypothetical protein